MPLQIIYVGSFYPWHGIELLLKAFSMAQARVPGLRLCLVGDGIIRSVSQKETRKLGIEHSVHFTAWLPLNGKSKTPESPPPNCLIDRDAYELTAIVVLKSPGQTAYRFQCIQKCGQL